MELRTPHGNFLSGVANPEIVYMLLRFQILCTDWFFKTLTLTEHFLTVNGTYMGRKQPYESFLKNRRTE